ncbi:MAG: aminotransferase class V-fold PLP-dependent enzyme [Gemmatimonadales bacterium]
MMDPAEIERLRAWRDATPGTRAVTHLNSAGASLMPQPVIEAMETQLHHEVQMGGYEAEAAAAAEIATTYATLGELVGAEARNIALAPSSSQAFLNAIASVDWSPGDVLLTSRLDYTSQQILYLSLALRLGVRIVTAPDLPEGGVDPQGVIDLLDDERPRLVAMSWVPTHAGTIQDLPAVGRACRNAGVPFLVDACQAVGQFPVDVADLHCDYLSSTGRKWLRGPRGIGFLYVADAALARGDAPLHVDMRGATWSTPNAMTLAPDARRFEEWEHSWLNVLGLGAAARYAIDVGLDVARDRARGFARDLRSWATETEGLRPADRGGDLSAIVTLEVLGREAAPIVMQLREQGINTSATLQWFGLADLGPRGIESAIRVSPHYFNTADEISRFKAAVESMVVPR